MNLQIRKAGPNDAVVIALLARITFAETFGYLFHDHPDDLRAYLDSTFALGKIERSLGQPRNTYWLGFSDGLPVAYAKLKYPCAMPLSDQGDAAQLQKIYVLREFVGQRIGKLLLQAALAHAASLRVPTIWLDVLKENDRAIRFYKQQGFTVLGDDTYSIGAQTFDFHLMSLGRARA
jgi:ribosomal protein S18 acetylase RimI-like enzyme